jgi:hypothetical protein
MRSGLDRDVGGCKILTRCCALFLDQYSAGMGGSVWCQCGQLVGHLGRV